MKLTFPSGREVTLDVTVHQTDSASHEQAVAIRRPVRRPGACKHVGKAVSVEVGCSGPQGSSVWTCDLHGQCAPLALHNIGRPDITVCALCDDWAAAPEPGWISLGLNFLSAIGRWQAAGSPVRSQSRVNELLAICEACPYLAGRGTDRKHCGKCGCPVNGRVDEPTKNKLAMATERCPLDPPRWEAEVK